MNWVALAVALSSFNTVFIVLLASRPREIFDSEGNVDYLKVFWLSLIGFCILIVAYFIVRLAVRVRER